MDTVTYALPSHTVKVVSRPRRIEGWSAVSAPLLGGVRSKEPKLQRESLALVQVSFGSFAASHLLFNDTITYWLMAPHPPSNTSEYRTVNDAL